MIDLATLPPNSLYCFECRQHGQEIVCKRSGEDCDVKTVSEWIKQCLLAESDSPSELIFIGNVKDLKP